MKCSTMSLLVVASIVLGPPAVGQEPALDSVLRFEAPAAGDAVPGWGGGPPGTIHFDTSVVHGGRGAARLERDARSPREFSGLTKELPLDVAGQQLELRGYLRTDGVIGSAGLWLREDGPGGPVQFDNMSDRGVSGTSAWSEYVIRLPLDSQATDLAFGALLSGTGRVWVDDVQLLVDGKPIGQAPKRPRAVTVLDTDREFATGSRITISSLTTTQVENVALLGMVWGFLKYHHPNVAAGTMQWDFELFRVLPSVLAAPDRAAANAVLTHWIERLGVPQSCAPCATAPQGAALLPRLGWIRDTALLGPALSQQLQAIYRYRFAGPKQFYVSRVYGVGNAAFDHELAYADRHPPDAGFRLLALFRYWNILEYWYPDRDVIAEDWHAVLADVLPRFIAASSWDDYRLALLALIARVHDTHANLWSDLDVRPPRGTCSWPVALRFVEGKAVVTAFSDTALGPASGLEIGDVITAIDGQPVDSLIAAWLPYYAASNRVTQLREIARFLPRGECGASAVTIDRDHASRTVPVARSGPPVRTPAPHDRPGEAFQLLSPEVAYLKLSAVRSRDVPGYLERAKGTRGLVIDIRNYPSAPVVRTLGSHLVDQPTPFVRFTTTDLRNPGAFTWTEPIVLRPAPPLYEGRVVILVDEQTQSQAEYTAMAFRARPGALVVGSTTAGADGNVSPIPLPGGSRTLISGIGVFYPDKRPTQQVGIVPDITVTPTIAGIREGRDEVLERALRQILGPDADPALIRRLAAPPR